MGNKAKNKIKTNKPTAIDLGSVDIRPVNAKCFF